MDDWMKGKMKSTSYNFPVLWTENQTSKQKIKLKRKEAQWLQKGPEHFLNISSNFIYSLMPVKIQNCLMLPSFHTAQDLFILRTSSGCPSTPMLYHKFLFFLTFNFVLGYSWSTMLWYKGFRWTAKELSHTVSPKLPSQIGFHINWVEFHVLDGRSLLVIHFKYSSVYMTIPNFLTIPSFLSFPLAAISSFSRSENDRSESV